jgi:hypothetical protein
MVVDVQHAPRCPHTPRFTSTNTSTYRQCCAVDMETGGGGHGSQVVPQATHPHKINRTHNCPPENMVVDVQHAPLCPHTPRFTSTNTSTYIRCCAVDMETGGGGHGSHVVPQATATLPHKKSKDKTHNCPPKNMVVDVQHAPLCPHTPRFTSTNTSTHISCCTVDMETGGGGHGSHVVPQATATPS